MRNLNKINENEINFKSINSSSFGEFAKKYDQNILKSNVMPLEKMKKPKLCDFINQNSATWFSATQLRHKKDYLVNLANDFYEAGEYINIRRQQKMKNVLC